MATDIGRSGETEGRAGEDPKAGPWLALWMTLVIVLRGATWLTGIEGYRLSTAVDAGAARVESRAIGEVGDDAIREAIRLQRESLPFWKALVVLGDFGAEPLLLATRAVVAATLFGGLAALTGRSIRFGEGLASCSASQGVWVLGMAVRVTLMIALHRPEAETSAALLLPPGTTPAPLWLALRQVDAFALLGWAVLARGAWSRGQTNLALAGGSCAVLWLGESILRVVAGLVLGAGMRLTLIPELA